MSGGGGKGGSQTSSVSYPPWIQEPAKRAIQRGEDISRIGYIPYEGPDVAALSPQQVSAMQGTQSAASAFGLPQANPLSNLPEAQTYAGGIQGYSGAPMAQQLIDDFRQNRPGQAALYDSLFVDPFNSPQAAPDTSRSSGFGRSPYMTPDDRSYGGLQRDWTADIQPTGLLGGII